MIEYIRLASNFATHFTATNTKMSCQ